jgi:hypothetical protein
MASSDVTITLAHFYDGKVPGDTLKLDEGTAKQLIQAGIAQPNAKVEEKAAASQPASKASGSA